MDLKTPLWNELEQANMINMQHESEAAFNHLFSTHITQEHARGIYAMPTK